MDFHLGGAALTAVSARRCSARVPGEGVVVAAAVMMLPPPAHPQGTAFVCESL